MNNIDHDLYHLMERRFGRDFVCSYDYQTVTQRFCDCMDQVEAACGHSFHEELYGIVMEYLTLSEYKSFRWGLRLALQLNSL